MTANEGKEHGIDGAPLFSRASHIKIDPSDKGQPYREGLFNGYKMQILSALDKANLTTHDRHSIIISRFEALLNKVVDTFDPSEQEKIVDALLNMIRLHASQNPRLSGETAVEHLLEVAGLLFAIVKDPKPEEIIVALLHDAIEDRARKMLAIGDFDNLAGSFADPAAWEQTVAKAQMEYFYGEKVRDMLNNLMKPDYERVITNLYGRSDLTAEEFQLENSRLYVDYLKKALDNPNVAVIKLVDFIDNATDVNEIPDEHEEQRTKIKSKYYGGFAVILEKLKDPGFAARLKDPEKLYEQMATVFEHYYQEGQF